MNINPKDWIFEYQQRGAQSPVMSHLWILIFKGSFQKELSLPIGKVDYLFINNKGFVKKKKKEELLSLLNSNLDKKYIDYICKTTMKRSLEFRLAVKKAIVEKDIVKSWNILTQSMLKVIPWLFIPWYIVEDDMLLVKLKKILDYDDESMFVLCMPQDDFMTTKEQKDYLNLVTIALSKGIKNSVFETKAKKYLKNYSWMKVFCLEPNEPLSYDELLIRVKKDLNKEFVLSEKEKIKKRITDLKKGRELFKKITDKKALELVTMIREISAAMSDSVEHVLETFALGIPVYKRVAKAMGVKFEDWVLFSYDEVCDALNGRVIDKSKVKARKQGFVITLIDNKVTVLQGEKIVNKFTNLIENKPTSDELFGKGVSKGKVRGRARILDGIKKMYFKKGEILITSMTSPVFLPQMKLSAAIITDEGGLLCHAAIVSRELGKPCVVGTRFATRVFEDGELIEVDAEKGVVRKIG